MDHHRQFRLNALNQARLLGHAPQGRLPLSQSPRVRPPCTPESASGSVRRPRPAAVPQPGRAAEPNRSSEQVRAQVKQLQFWLRVFSRFCQNKPEQE